MIPTLKLPAPLSSSCILAREHADFIVNPAWSPGLIPLQPYSWRFNLSAKNSAESLTDEPFRQEPGHALIVLLPTLSHAHS